MEDHAIERELIPEKAIKETIGKDGNTKVKELKLGHKLEGNALINMLRKTKNSGSCRLTLLMPELFFL